MVHLFAWVWILHLNVPTATDADQEPNEGGNDFSNLLNKFQEANTNTDLRFSLWFYAGPDTNIYSKHRLWETHTDCRSLRIIIFEKRRKKRVQPKTRSVAYTSPHALSHSVIRMLVAVVYCRVMGSGWGSADIGANISLSLPHTHTHTHNCWSNISQETLWSRRNERANPFSPLRSLSLSCSLSLSKTILYLSLSVVLSSSFLVNNIFPLSLSFCLSATFTSKNPVKGREREREWESATELNIHTSVCIYVLRGDWSAWFAERLGLINPPFKPNDPSSASFHLHSASVCLCTFLHVSTFISIKRWKFSSSCSEVLECKCGPVTGSVIC